MPTMCDYPLRFRPVFRRYLWGGRRLGTMLNKPIGDGDDYAESWEVVDHGDDQSIVEFGPLAGEFLTQLVREQGPALLGMHDNCARFPLLMKLLDCNRTLSVQVHPNDQQAAQLDPPDLGKTEAWVVLAAGPGSKIYAGLRPGVTRETLAAALEAGTCEECLHEFAARPGDCVFIPAGTVHALGAGLVIAEIQQASDTTFRLFDWNRVDAQGNPRPLHVEQSLDTIDFARGPIQPQRPAATGDPGRERLVRCDQFVLDRVRVDVPRTLGGDRRCHLLLVVQGQLRLKDDPAEKPLARGQTALLPAEAGPVNTSPVDGPQGEAIVLDAYLP